MIGTPRTWLPSVLVLLATLLPLHSVAESYAHVWAVGALALDVLGVMAARAAWGRIASALGPDTGAARNRRPGWPSPPPSSTGFERALLTLTGASDRRAALQWCQSVVHSAGMGFGLSAVLLVCYLAYLYGF